MSELAQVAMDADAARRLTERIRIAAVNYSEAKEKLLRLVSDAKEGAAHVALGYASWTAYLADVMSEEPLRLARDERREVVQLLSDEGVSRPAIAQVTGVNERTTQRDFSAIRQGGTHVSPSPSLTAPSPRFVGGADEEELAPAPKVTGMDGKQYSRSEYKPQPPKPRADAITAQFSSAVVELNRVLDKFHRIQSNPNFPANKNQVATLHGNDLARSVSELQNLADQLH